MQHCNPSGFSISVCDSNPHPELQKQQEKRRKEGRSWRGTCSSVWQPSEAEQWSVRLPVHFGDLQAWTACTALGAERGGYDWITHPATETITPLSPSSSFKTFSAFLCQTEDSMLLQIAKTHPNHPTNNKNPHSNKRNPKSKRSFSHTTLKRKELAGKVIPR